VTHPNPFTAAAEYVSIELSLARTRQHERSAAERLCQILELLDFHEFALLHDPAFPPHVIEEALAAD
jgi:hypothetical protein